MYSILQALIHLSINTLTHGKINVKHQQCTLKMKKLFTGDFCDYTLYLKIICLNLMLVDLWFVKNQEVAGIRT